jgi:hypothetical protein
MIKRSVPLLALAISIFAGSALAQDAEKSVQVNEKTALESKLWSLPAVPQQIDTFQVIDTQPETREIARDRAVHRLGYSINEIARSHRLHIDYLPGSDNLTYQETESIRNLVKGSNEQDRVVITGYSGKGDPEDGVIDLAKERSEKIRAVIERENRQVVVRTDSTIYWGGNPGQGRRVEIFLVPGLD